MKPDPMTPEQISEKWSDAHDDTSPKMPYQTFARAIEAARDKQWEEMLSKQDVPETNFGNTGIVACLVGMRGSAFDTPSTKRAYTYDEQPGNVVAFKLGTACVAAWNISAGDSIDRGLGLLKELQLQGFGVFDMGAEYTASTLPVMAVKQEPVSREFRGRDGKWYPFHYQLHYVNTVADGTWPIRHLYAAPVDQAAEIERLKELVDLALAALTVGPDGNRLHPEAREDFLKKLGEQK